MQPRILKAWRAVAFGSSAVAVALTVYSLRVSREPAPTRATAAAAPVLVQQPLEREQAQAAATVPPVVDRAAALALLRERLNQAPDSELSDVASAVANLGGHEAFVLLSAATHSPRSALRNAAFLALAGVDTVETRDFMRRALNGPDAASALSYFLDCRDPEALPALERLARSPAPELNRAALDALLAQGERAEAAFARLLQADTELMDALLTTPPHTPNARRALRTAAIRRLHDGALSGGPVFDFLEQDLSAESREALLFAAHDPASADSACAALARKGDPAALAALSQLASDPDPQLAAAASCALAADPDSRSRVPLERVLYGQAHSIAARALAHINAPGARAI